MDNHKTW